MTTSVHYPMESFSLILIPVSLNEEEGLDKSVSELISLYETKQISYEVLVESEKNSRRRWLKSGLNRDKISQFITYNEHTQEKENISLIQQMERGVRFLLMCDEGLPTFFDPGQKLVSLMHKKNLKMRCLSFPCSPILALVLSGFDSSRFSMLGFPPVKTEDREDFFFQLLQKDETVILMDTAYRLKQTLEHIAKYPQSQGPRFFLGLDLARVTEEYFVGQFIKS